MRDNKWLKYRLEAIWRRYFPDVPIANTVFVRFGRRARTRLGSIKFGRRKINPNTYVTLTGYFQDERVPEFVVDAVLAHELTHYTHGFNSPHERLFHHPHQHRVVDRELTQRGLADILVLQKRWLKDHWREVINNLDF